VNDDDDLFADAPGAPSDAAPFPAEVRVPVGDLPLGGTRVFRFARGGWDHTGFVVRHARGFRAFVNRCPHVPYPLDWDDGRFMGPEGLLVCQTHGARFDPATGRCVGGPAVGRALERLPFREEGDELIVTILPEPPSWPRAYDPDAVPGG